MKIKNTTTIFSIVILSLLSACTCSFAASAVSQVRITEIMYDPSGDGSKEFIELHNGSNTTANLSGWSMYGVDFVFSGGVSLVPGEYLVIARNMATLQATHPGRRIAGQYGGKLRGTGELVRVMNASGQPVSEVSYSFGGAWPLEPRNGGASLSLVRTTANEALPGCWGVSSTLGGSPGYTNSVSSGGGGCSDVAYLYTPPPAPPAPSPTSTPTSNSSSQPTSSSKQTAKSPTSASQTQNNSNQNVVSKSDPEDIKAQIKKEEQIEKKNKEIMQKKKTHTTQQWIWIGALFALVGITIAGLFIIRKIKIKRDIAQIIQKNK